MTELAKTIAFTVVGLALAGVAYVTRPEAPEIQDRPLVGRILFEQFEDPSQAARLEIVRYDEELGELHEFEVARRGDLWTIPSHANYPADAADQLRDAALSLVGLKVFGVVTESPGEHEMFGVIEPSRDTTQLGDQGVGVMVTFRDDDGDEMAQLIIGHEIRNTDGHRFVRVPGQDIVYDVKIDPDRLSTRFADWIEEDLLKLNAFDIEQLTMKDYSVVPSADGSSASLELRTEAAVNWIPESNRWELARLNIYRGRQAEPSTLLETEELNTARLDAAKSALADLKIVDVRRKPQGLGANLRLDASFARDDAGSTDRQDLISRGFYPNQAPNGEFELLSANGEIHVKMSGSYRYVLRFGGVEGTDSAATGGGLNRYLFVTAVTDPIPPPALEELPELPAADEAAGESAGDRDAEERRLIAERERIKRSNDRLTEEWREQKQAAEAKVNELNARFADWFYVIDEDVYRKIHLSRSDIIKETAEAADEGFGVDSFRRLEATGLRKN